MKYVLLIGGSMVLGWCIAMIVVAHRINNRNAIKSTPVYVIHGDDTVVITGYIYGVNYTKCQGHDWYAHGDSTGDYVTFSECDSSDVFINTGGKQYNNTGTGTITIDGK